MDVIVSRCAGLDVHKDTVMACVRKPGPDGGRTSTVRRFRTFTASLRELRAWLVAEGVTQVAMEATGELPPLCRSRLYLSGSSWARW